MKVTIDNLDALKEMGKEMGRTAGQIDLALVRSTNRIAERGRTRAKDLILDRLAFPKSYLAPADGNLYVGKRATRASPFATIKGSDYPAPLSRFIRGAPRPGKGITIMIKPGKLVNLKNAFLIGSAPDQGLAIRTAKGSGRPTGSRTGARKLKNADNIWVLYGPAVDQALKYLRDKTTLNQWISDRFADEFLRQLRADLK